MIRKDIVVKRPEGTKIYRQRGCVYVYQVTGKTYNSDKRYVVEDRKCIGKMINDTEMNPNENYFEFYDDVELGEPEVQYVRGKMILPSHGKEFFTSRGKHFFTPHGKQFFTYVGNHFLT